MILPFTYSILPRPPHFSLSSPPPLCSLFVPPATLPATHTYLPHTHRHHHTTTTTPPFYLHDISALPAHFTCHHHPHLIEGQRQDLDSFWWTFVFVFETGTGQNKNKTDKTDRDMGMFCFRHFWHSPATCLPPACPLCALPPTAAAAFQLPLSSRHYWRALPTTRATLPHRFSLLPGVGGEPSPRTATPLPCRMARYKPSRLPRNAHTTITP